MIEAAGEEAEVNPWALRMEQVSLRSDGLRPGLDRRHAAAQGAKTILDRIDLSVARGKVLSLVGQSGSGKSALLRLINRLSEPCSGRIEVLGRAVSSWSPRALRRAAVLVPQTPVLLGGSVEEELLRPLLWAHAPIDHERLERARRLAQIEEIPLDRPSDELSGGERARVAIARALVLEPPLLLLDEPNAALDRQLAARLLGGLARAWREAGRTLLVVTHRLEALATLGGEVAVLEAGTLFGPYPVAGWHGPQGALPAPLARLWGEEAEPPRNGGFDEQGASTHRRENRAS